MKKLLSAVLAASMIAGMAVTSFAASTPADVAWGSGHSYDDAVVPPTAKVIDNTWNDDLYEITHTNGVDYEVGGYEVAFDTAGELFEWNGTEGRFEVTTDGIGHYDTKYGYVIYFHPELERNARDRYRAYADWTLGDDAVEDIDIEYLKADGASGNYEWFVTFTTTADTSANLTDIAGKITVARSKSDADENMKDGVDDYAGAGTSFDTEGGALNSWIYYAHNKIPSYDADGKDFAGELEDIEMFEGDVVFTVDTTNQNTKLNLSHDGDFDDDFAAMYPEANLYFYNWDDAPAFNRTGDLYFYVNDDIYEDQYIYAVTEDGAEEVDFEWDEEYEAFVVKTRVLDSYVVSDMELEIAPEEVEVPEEPEEDKETPATGGPTTVPTVEGTKYNPNTGR